MVGLTAMAMSGAEAGGGAQAQSGGDEGVYELRIYHLNEGKQAMIVDGLRQSGSTRRVRRERPEETPGYCLPPPPARTHFILPSAPGMLPTGQILRREGFTAAAISETPASSRNVR